MDETFDFSYSGLKSYIINLVHNEKQKGNEINRKNLAASFQKAAVEELTRKVNLALKKTNIKNLIVAGGVSANRYLRERLKEITEINNAKLFIPDFIYCTDNAAMIGAAAYPLFLNKEFADFSLNAESQANVC